MFYSLLIIVICVTIIFIIGYEVGKTKKASEVEVLLTNLQNQLSEYRLVVDTDERNCRELKNMQRALNRAQPDETKQFIGTFDAENGKWDIWGHR